MASGRLLVLYCLLLFLANSGKECRRRHSGSVSANSITSRRVSRSRSSVEVEVREKSIPICEWLQLSNRSEYCIHGRHPEDVLVILNATVTNEDLDRCDSPFHFPVAARETERVTKRAKPCYMDVTERARYWCQGFPRCCFNRVYSLLHEFHDCDTTSGVLQIRITYEAVKRAKVHQKCDGGATYRPEYHTCIMGTYTPDTWENARRDCQMHKGDLAFIPPDFDMGIKLVKRQFVAGAHSEMRGPGLHFQESTVLSAGKTVFGGKEGEELFGLCALPPRTRTYSVIHVKSGASMATTPVVGPVQVAAQTATVYCPSQTVQGITWGPTPAGESTRMPCPRCADCNVAQNATWTCGSNATWTTSFPDMSNCTQYSSLWSDAFAAVQNREVLPSKALHDTAVDLRQKQQYVSMQAGDVSLAVKLVNESLQIAENTINNTCKRRPDICTSVVSNYTHAALQLANVTLTSPMAWNTNNEKLMLATDMMNIIDIVAFQALQYDLQINETLPQLAVSSVSLRTSQMTQNSLTYTFDLTNGTTITLPSTAKGAGSLDGVWKAVFVSYNDLNVILGTGDQMPENVEEGNPVTNLINAKIISATLGSWNKSVTFIYGDQAQIRFRHIYSGSHYKISDPVCVFWNDMEKQWSTSGCSVVDTDNDWTTCQCDHLTSMALLMNCNGIYSEEEIVVLTFVTIIGCTISIVCLVMCIIIFTLIRSLWNIRNSIHRNLCLSLCVGQVTLLTGVTATSIYGLCKAVAIILHYFYLASFCWMLLEGYQIYVSLVKVFDTLQLKLRYYYLVGYGIPLLVVVISAACFWDGYGTENYCWLSTERGFVWAFLGPVIVILLCNFVILVVALVKAHKALKQADNAMGGTPTRQKSKWLKGIFSLSVISGMTWLTGIFLFGPVPQNLKLVLEIMFSLLNSLQGLFIFVFHCLMQDNVQAAVAKKWPWLPCSAKHKAAGMTSLRQEEMTNSSSRRRLLVKGTTSVWYNIAPASESSPLRSENTESTDASTSSRHIILTNGNELEEQSQL